ncbi:unnamed protein product [Periconia digitata]|uniref:Uncharacterized protein n=1 Tax=Periconia digitata TaxID=1303443 RepID=A0A9W4UUE7_9PLEO|nr:unnamed protein product [Periconia digitata]
MTDRKTKHQDQAYYNSFPKFFISQTSPFLSASCFIFNVAQKAGIIAPIMLLCSSHSISCAVVTCPTYTPSGCSLEIGHKSCTGTTLSINNG